MRIVTNNANGKVSRTVEGRPEAGLWRFSPANNPREGKPVLAVETVEEFVARIAGKKSKAARSIARDCKAWLRVHGDSKKAVERRTRLDPAIISEQQGI